MKVYIVIEEFISQSKILKVFDSGEKANQFINNYNWHELCHIETYDLE